jgi:ribosomal protein S18 acetylase RimI-like enzyme
VEGTVIRQYRDSDRPTVWALSQLPHLGETADPAVPLDLPERDGPGSFDDLRNIHESFIGRGGDFLVIEFDSRVVAMGGIIPNERDQAEVLRIRVHPALRRRGLGRALMSALEERAAQLGLTEMHLDTTVQQPEAVAFYRALGYQEVGREEFPHWELIYFVKQVDPKLAESEGSADSSSTHKVAR